MQNKYIQILTLAVTTAAATILFTGCASSGYDKGNKTAENIQSAADKIATLPGQIEATLSNLNAMVENPQTDLRPQFKEFSSNVAELESSARSVGAARKCRKLLI